MITTNYVTVEGNFPEDYPYNPLEEAKLSRGVWSLLSYLHKGDIWIAEDEFLYVKYTRLYRINIKEP